MAEEVRVVERSVVGYEPDVMFFLENGLPANMFEFLAEHTHWYKKANGDYYSWTSLHALRIACSFWDELSPEEQWHLQLICMKQYPHLWESGNLLRLKEFEEIELETLKEMNDWGYVDRMVQKGLNFCTKIKQWYHPDYCWLSCPHFSNCEKR